MIVSFRNDVDIYVNRGEPRFPINKLLYQLYIYVVAVYVYVQRKGYQDSGI